VFKKFSLTTVEDLTIRSSNAKVGWSDYKMFAADTNGTGGWHHRGIPLLNP
jgi:hypothetical protein